jgi:hypothetical protein
MKRSWWRPWYEVQVRDVKGTLLTTYPFFFRRSAEREKRRLNHEGRKPIRIMELKGYRDLPGTHLYTAEVVSVRRKK